MRKLLILAAVAMLAGCEGKPPRYHAYVGGGDHHNVYFTRLNIDGTGSCLIHDENGKERPTELPSRGRKGEMARGGLVENRMD